MQTFNSKRVGRAVLSAAVVSVGLVSQALAVPSAFEIEGNLNAAGDQQDFLFTTSAALSSSTANSLKFETFQYAGGTNLYGDAIVSGGIDSVLNLFSGASNIAKNDDKNTSGARDSLLSWSPATPTNATSVPVSSPLAAGAYRLNMAAFNNTGTGRYNLEMLADSFTFTGVNATGNATIKSLKFAATQTTGTAQFTLASGTMTLQDTFTAGVTLNGFDFLANANLTGGTLAVGGITTVGHGSSITLSSGIFNANGDVNVLGSITGPSSVFNLATNKSLNVTGGGVVNFTGNYSLSGGKTINVQAGSSFTTQSYLDVGNGGGTGTVIVNGAGASLSTSTVNQASNLDWGINGGTANVTISNTATATINAPTLNIATSAVGSGTVLVNTGSVMTAKNTNIATGTGGIGSITVDGSLSSVSLVGASTLSLGAASGATGTGTINVNNSGVFNTGTGTINVNKTGTINIGGGTFNAKGDINFNGGKLLATTGLFTLATGKNLVASNAAQISLNQTFFIGAGESITVQSGASLSATDGIGVPNGTLLVTGLGSLFASATAGGLIPVYGNGASSTVTIADQATATFNTTGFYMANGGSAASNSVFNVTSGGHLTVGYALPIAPGNAGTGTMTVTGAGSDVTVLDDAAVTVGALGASTSVGTLNVNSSGVFNSGTGGININKTGTVNIGGGTVNANGNVNIDGGKLLHTSGTFNLAAGKNLTASNSAQVSFAGGFSLANGGTVTIQSGSSISATDFLGAGYFGNGSLVVTGLGSSLSAGGSPNPSSSYGFGGFSGSLTVSDQAIATYNSTNLSLAAFDNNPASTGTVVVNTQGKLNTKSILVGTNVAGTGTLTVNGSGSVITQAGASTLTLGGTGASTSVGTINIQNSGVFNSGTGAISIRKTGTINIAGGTLNANGDVTLDGGKLLHTSGTFNLAAGKNLTASNSAQVSFGSTYTVGGGSTFTIQSGSSLSMPSTAVLNIGSGSGNGTLVATGLGTSLTIGAPGSGTGPNWGSNGSTANVTISNQAIADINYDILALTFSFSAASNSTLNVTSGAQFNAKGMQMGNGAAGSSVVTITGTNSKLTTLGTSGASLIIGGTGTSSGILNIQSGGALDSSGGQTQISSKGTINNPGGTFTAADILNNGNLTSASGTTVQGMTGTGNTTVSGGTFDSTLGIAQGSVALSNDAVMTIAPNGASTGVSVFNAFTAINTSKLDLKNNDLIVDYNATGVSPYTTIRGYVISGLGVSHTGITSSTLTAGTSLAVVDDLGTLSTTSGLPISHPLKSVVVKYTWLGDANLDGKVDGTDYALTDSGFAGGGTTWNQGDYNYSGGVDGTDYALIDTGFGSQSGTLPEPATIGLLGLGALGMLRRNRRITTR